MREFPLGLPPVSLPFAGVAQLTSGGFKMPGTFRGERLVLVGFSKRCRTCGNVRTDQGNTLITSIVVRRADGTEQSVLSDPLPGEVFQPNAPGLRFAFTLNTGDSVVLHVKSCEKRRWFKPWRWFGKLKIQGVVIGVLDDSVDGSGVRPPATPATTTP